MKAYGENVVVKPTKAPTVSTGGIHLPGAASDRYARRGTVISIGSDVEGVNLKDEIVFTMSDPVEVDDDIYIVVHKKHILAIL